MSYNHNNTNQKPAQPHANVEHAQSQHWDGLSQVALYLYHLRVNKMEALPALPAGCLWDERLGQCLISHLLTEFPKVKWPENWLNDQNISEEVTEKLHFVALRRTFTGTCEVCASWQDDDPSSLEELATTQGVSTTQAFDLFFKDATGRITDKSKQTYRQIASQFEHDFPTIPTDPRVVDRWFNGLQVSKGTRWTNFYHLLAIFRRLNEDYGIPNPMATLKSPPRNRDMAQALTTDELNRVVAMPLSQDWGNNAKRDYVLLRVLQRSGIRISGALGLEQSSLRDGYLIVTEKGKTHAVGCDNETINLLRNLGHPHIFMGQRGPLGYLGARAVIKKALKLAGLDRKGVGAHVLRRGFASIMTASGVPTASLSRMMGHASIKQTDEYIRQDIQGLVDQYTKLSPWAPREPIATGNKIC